MLQLPRATQVPHAGDASRGCRTSHVPQVPRAAGAAGARKSVRIRSPELRPGRIFVKRTREIRCGIPGPWGAKCRDLEVGGWGAHVCYSLPSLEDGVGDKIGFS